jgi:hypothetical protein
VLLCVAKPSLACQTFLRAPVLPGETRLRGAAILIPSAFSRRRLVTKSRRKIEGRETGYPPQLAGTRRFPIAHRSVMRRSRKFPETGLPPASILTRQNHRDSSKRCRSRQRSKNATPQLLSSRSLNGGVQKPLMTDLRRVHSMQARHSPCAIRNKGLVLRSSAGENGCLLSEFIERRSNDFAEANAGCVDCQDVARRGV